MVKDLKGLIAAHESSHHAAFELMEQFHEILLQTSLPRRAGELQQVLQIEKITQSMAREILPHFEKEEHELYPYLTSHVPKLETVVQYLISEHEDFREIFQDICLLLEDLQHTSEKILREKSILKLQESGTYLFFLFRNHLRAEREGLLRVMEETLHPEEKAEVLKLL